MKKLYTKEDLEMAIFKEREECAKLCEPYCPEDNAPTAYNYGFVAALNQCAKEIRNRSFFTKEKP